MTNLTVALCQLHRIHRQLTDLRERISRGPKQLRAAEGNVLKNETELQQTRDAARRMRVLADDKQLQLKEREGRIQDLKGKLNACSSNREYQALKEQIAADEQANGVLSDEILEALERMDELAAKQKSADETLQRIKQEAEKLTSRVTGEQGMLQSELARVQSELKQAELELPADFRLEYERIAKARGEQALAQIEGETCGGCYQTVTVQTMNQLYMSKPVFCKSCGCLLYLPEDRMPKAKT